MFKSFKTVVVTLTMLAVGYGAHVVLNRPLPSNDNPFANSEGWNTPDLTLRDGQTLRPDIRLDAGHAGSQSLSPQVNVPLPAAGPVPVQGPGLTHRPAANDALNVAPPVAHQDHSPGFPELLPLTANNTSPPAHVVGPAVPNSGPPLTSAPSADPAPQGGATNLAATADSHPAVADYGGATNAQTMPAPPPVVPDPVWDAQVQNASAVGNQGAVPPQAGIHGLAGIDGPFKAIWNAAQAKLASRDYAQALFTLSLSYGDPSLSSQRQDQILPLLDQLAGTVIYSRENHLLQPHTVQPGESVAQIANRYSLPPEFLARVNGLRPEVALQPGQTLKVVQGPFRGQLNLTRRELTLFLNRYYAGRFVVNVGCDAPSEEMVLQVAEKSGPRPFQDPATGQLIPPNDPSNPYGGHWIGLQTPGTMATNLAIHSSGVQLDASDTRGCFSVSPKDANDLMAILSVGSRVSVVR